MELPNIQAGAEGADICAIAALYPEAQSQRDLTGDLILRANDAQTTNCFGLPRKKLTDEGLVELKAAVDSCGACALRGSNCEMGDWVVQAHEKLS